MRKSDFTLPTLDDLFSTQAERDDAKLERVRNIPLAELHPFKGHPFKVQNNEEMQRMIESIRKVGAITPALARSLPGDGKIAFNPAVELSYLDSYQQRAVLDAMALNDCAPSHAQSIRLKKLAQEGVLDDQIVYAVLAETKPNQQEQLEFKREELQKYFPSGYTEEQMRRDIIKGLELLKRQRERNRDAR